MKSTFRPLRASAAAVLLSAFGLFAECIAGIAPPPAQDAKLLAIARKVDLPPGERYEATVPDTLDLAERCRLAARGMVWSGSAISYDHEPYSMVCYDHR